MSDDCRRDSSGGFFGLLLLLLLLLLSLLFVVVVVVEEVLSRQASVRGALFFSASVSPPSASAFLLRVKNLAKIIETPGSDGTK